MITAFAGLWWSLLKPAKPATGLPAIEAVRSDK